MKKLYQGNEASAIGALDGGLDLFAGYPITPSSEILEVLSKEMPKRGKTFIQMEDEISSIAVITAAGLSGKKALTATSGPGFSLMQEGLSFACMVESPCVIVNVMRGDPSTGLPTHVGQGDYMQSKWGTHGDHPIIVFSPGSVQEFYWLTRFSLDISKYFRNPVIVLSDETVAHMRAEMERSNPPYKFEFSSLPKPDKPYNFERDLISAPYLGDGKGIKITGLFHDEYGFPDADEENAQKLIDHLLRKVYSYRRELFYYEEETEGKDLVLVSFGIMGTVIKEVKRNLERRGIKAGFLRLITLNPLDEEKIKQMLSEAKIVFVVELNKGQLYLDIERIMENKTKVYPINFVRGNVIPPEEIESKILEVIG